MANPHSTLQVPIRNSWLRPPAIGDDSWNHRAPFFRTLTVLHIEPVGVLIMVFNSHSLYGHIFSPSPHAL